MWFEVTITATDNVMVTGYAVTLNGVVPDVNQAGRWYNPMNNAGFSVPVPGTYTIYAWAKDYAGNLSDPVTTTATVFTA